MTDTGPGRRFFIVDEDQLRAKIFELAPEIRRDTELEADMIRELIKLEREKLGLDNPRGTIGLRPNNDKRAASDPDWIGAGRVAGRFYGSVAAWASKTGTLRISLLPHKRK